MRLLAPAPPLLALLAALCMAGAPRANAAPSLEMWRLDCGSFVTRHLTDSCYLIRHGRDLMLWDTGLAASFLHKPRERNGSVVVLRRTLASQLAALHLEPRRITIVALSHLHSDHTGQATAFPRARLILGRKDWRMLTAAAPKVGLEPAHLEPWIEGRSPKSLVDGDYDVFGDGSVIMLATPGHTPGRSEERRVGKECRSRW